MKKINGFTLIELIVVITILVILGAISYLTLKGHTSSARDSVRISNLNSAKNGLEMSILKRGYLSNPDSSIIVYEKNLSDELLKIGKFGKTAKTFAKISKEVIDPQTKEDFYYTKSGKYNKFELSTKLENPTVFSQTAQASNINIYETGYPLKSIYNPDFTIPSSNIDITNIDTSKKYKYISGKKLETILGNNFYQARLNYSCSKKSELGLGANKNSKINPENTSEIEIDCTNNFMQNPWTNIYANNFDDISEFNRDYKLSNLNHSSVQSVTDGIFKTVRNNGSGQLGIARSLDLKNEIYMQMKFKTSGNKRRIYLNGHGIRYDDSGCIGICLGSTHKMGDVSITNKDEYSTLDYYINESERKVIVKINGKEYYNGDFPSYFSNSNDYIGKFGIHSRHFTDSIEIDYLIIATK